MGMRYHLPSLASLPDVELAAVCDIVEERAREAAGRFGIPRVYTDYRRMLAEVDPEAVWLILRPQDLFEPARRCLEERRHVFVEKPLALTVWQARALAHLAERNDCRTMVGFQRRHIPALTALRRRLEERGRLWQVTVAFLKAMPLHEPHWIYGGAIDALTSDGIHAVDCVRFLAGGEVVRLAVDTRRMYVPGPFPNAVTAMLTFSTGVVGVLQFYYTTGRRIFRTEIHGRNATAYVDADRESYFVADDGQPEVRPSREFGTLDGAPGTAPEHWLGFWHEQRHFVDCVQTGREPSSCFADAVKTMELVERLLVAGSEG
jgi:virulence factor